MSTRPIPYVDLAAQYAQERSALLPLIDQCLAGGQWVGGEAVPVFEQRLATYCGARHCVAVGSGTDALMLAMQALGLGPGDEVITPPNSFVASTASIARIGATPVFADVLADQNIDPDDVARRITPRTRAIMPVHLTGRVARMRELRELADRHGLMLIEDAAQSLGSRYDGAFAGTLGDVGCFSAHPLKNLNAAGDAGMVLTEDDAVAERLRRLRNNGLVDRQTVGEWGTVSRLDSLQAVILSHRLDALDGVVAARRRNAALYREALDPAHVFVPPCAAAEHNTFHTFVIQVDGRDGLQAHLQQNGIGTAIHYPVPIHLQPAAAALGHRRGSFPVTERQADRILSLPIHQHLCPADIERVAGLINTYLRG